MTRQLAPLMQACMSCPVPQGAPLNLDEIRLLDRQSKSLSVDASKGSKPAEALRILVSALHRPADTRQIV